MDDEKADALARFESRCARLAESQGLSTELVRDAILDPTPEEAVTWQARHGVDEVSDYDVSTIQDATARASAVLRGERHMVQVFDVWLANARRIRPEGHYDPKPAPVEAADPAPDGEEP